MDRSRTGFHAGVVGLMLIMILAAGPVALARQVATPEADCLQHDGPSTSRLGTLALATPGTLSHGGPVVDHVSFVDALRACDVTVAIGGAVEQPFLRAEAGVVLHLSGGGLVQQADVQSFAYEDAATAATDAAQLGPDGNLPTMMIEWIAPPHFFRVERVIVLYVGDDQAVINLLIDLLGPPFVG